MITSRDVKNSNEFNISEIDSAIYRLTNQEAMIQDSMNTKVQGSYNQPVLGTQGGSSFNCQILSLFNRANEEIPGSNN